MNMLTSTRIWALGIAVLITATSKAQLTNCNVFLKGNYVEVGININGAFGSSEPAPAGYHARGGVTMKNTCTGGCSGTQGLGWVADPARDGWTVGTPAYFGDYFLPGSPQEGWSVEDNGSQGNAWNQGAGCSSGTLFSGANTITGNNIAYSNTGSRITGTWQGRNRDSITITQVTTLDTGNLFFSISVTLKNNSAFTRNNVYYLRTVDPDNEVAITGSYTTINTVVYQLPDTLNATLVTAVGTTYSAAYLGLGTLDCRAKCFILNSGLSPTVNCDSLYIGSSTVRYSGTTTADAGIGIVFNLGNLAPGDSVSFSYAYILNTSDLTKAFEATRPNWTATGDTAAGIHAVGDTANVCIGALTTVTITNPGDYTWNWTSLTGETLSTYTGPSTQVLTDTTIISLRAIGTGSCSGLPDTLYLNLSPSKPLPNTPTAGSNTPVCEGSPLNLTSSTVTAGSSFSWVGPAGFTSGLQNPTIASATLGAAGVYTVYAVHAGCYSDSAATTTVVINPLPAPISGSAGVCIGSTTALSDATGSGTWSSTNTAVATIGTSGVVTSVSVGTTIISYTIPTGCAATMVVTVNPLPNAITGPTTVCVASAITLSDTSPGGTWSSSNTGVATAGSSTGVITGVAQGTATITYMLNTGCIRTASVLINPIPAAISGASSVCVGSATTLSDATFGGIWSSSNTAVATISFGGVAGGVAAGTSIITYGLLTGCNRTLTMTVNPLPAAITGTTSICVLSTTILSDATASGTWTSSNTGVAAVGSSTGIVTGVTQGSATITYSLSTGCTRTTSVLVNPIPAVINGTTSVCAGLTTSLSDATAAGAWSSSNTAVATVSGTGIVTGVSAGTATIFYTLVTGCNRSVVVTVNPLPSAIAGIRSVCAGATTSLSDATAGGTWSSSNTAVATIGGTGLVTGATAGTTTITYTLGTGCITTAGVTVNANPAAITPAGAIGICVGSTAALSDATPGGIWSSGDITIATVNATGVVTGVLAGTANISYTNAAGCPAVKTITVNITPTAISPASPSVCTGNTTFLTDGVTGGVWTSSDITVATVNAGTGMVSGVAAGTAMITYTIGSCFASTTLTVNLSPVAGTISGPVTGCVGATITLTDAAPGGVWSSSNTSVATVSATGIVTGVSGGAVIITYAVTNSCGTVYATYNVTILAFPTAGTIIGASTICAGTYTILLDTAAGGVWSSSNSTASITSTGLLTGIIPGTDTIYYTVANICGLSRASKVINIGIALSAGSISGPSSECTGASITLSDPAPGGVWSASNSAASVSGSGVVTGLTGGVDTIRYTVTASCGSAVAIHVVTVIPIPSGGTIIGVSAICAGMVTTYTDAVSGGIWGVSNSTANINSAGVLTAITAGPDTVLYVVTNACGTATAFKPIIIGSPISAGSITGPNNVCQGAAVTLTDATTGGVWTTSNANATVSGGVVTGVTAGTVTISYTVTSSCGSVSAIFTVTVNPAPNAGSISGPSVLCSGASFTYTDAATGGVWSMANANATITGGGLVTPVSAGPDTIFYTVTNTWCTVSATKAVTIGITPVAGSISGAGSVCIGGSPVTMTDPAGGGVWSSTNATATVGSSTGIVTGVTPGSDTIVYTVSNVCGTAIATTTIMVNPAPFAGSITGPASVCADSFTIYVDGAGGGMWSSSNATATITSAGVLTAMSAGIDTISYTVTNACGTAVATKTISISTGVSAGTIAGPASVCIGSAITLTDTAAGGVWSSSNATATIGSSSGIVTGTSAGADTVYYTVTAGCGTAIAMAVVTVSPIPNAGFISGGSGVCIGSAITLTDAVAGGIWSPGSPSIAAVSATGVVSGIAVGVATISYTITNSCGTASATHTVAVANMPAAGTISGPSNVCIGSTVTLTDAVTGGVWSSSNTKATITAGGVVTGLATGIDTISYTVSNACGTATASKTISVIVAPNAGSISGPAMVCVGGTIILTDGTGGGAWSASNNRASVTGGIVTGITPGQDTIRYTVTSACGTATALKIISIRSAPGVSSIMGPTSVCTGATITLTDFTTGGLWGNSNPGIASVSMTGTVTGIAPGIANINYTVSNGCGNASASHLVTVLPASDCNTAVSSVANGDDIQVTPNPSNGSFSIKGATGMTDEEVFLEVTDIIGQSVYRHSAMAKGGIIDEQVILGNTIANGTYLLSVRSQSGNRLFHIVIRR
jgi:trimeric autotransporter adhesin